MMQTIAQPINAEPATPTVEPETQPKPTVVPDEPVPSPFDPAPEGEPAPCSPIDPNKEYPTCQLPSGFRTLVTS